MKKILSLILALAMVLSLVACGGEAEAPAAEAPAAQPESAGEAAALPVPYPEKTVKIGVEIYDPTDSETLTMSEQIFHRTCDNLWFCNLSVVQRVQ